MNFSNSNMYIQAMRFRRTRSELTAPQEFTINKGNDLNVSLWPAVTFTSTAKTQTQVSYVTILRQELNKCMGTREDGLRS